MVLVHPAAPPNTEALDTTKSNGQDIKDAFPATQNGAEDEGRTLRFQAATITTSFPHDAEKRLTWATWNGREATKKVVSKTTAIAMLEALEALVKHEPTLVEVGCLGVAWLLSTCIMMSLCLYTGCTSTWQQGDSGW